MLPDLAIKIMWDAIRPDHETAHALRCSCRVFRNCTAPFITHRTMALPDERAIFPVGWPNGATLEVLKVIR